MKRGAYGKLQYQEETLHLARHKSFPHNNVLPQECFSFRTTELTYKRYIGDAYELLFAQAVAGYNAGQKRRDRCIEDYYQHIVKGKREEAFYEVVVQFGDVQTARCGTPQGDAAKQMLDEFMKDFQRRNPNLYVFNAVLHMDEASPHLHIDFIPFYTRGRKNGLQKGVSMKAALDEMGFRAKGQRENRLVAWEERERAEMENILHRHGFQREDKHAHYAHMTVEEFKLSKDTDRLRLALKQLRGVSPKDTSAENLLRIRMQLSAAEHRVDVLEQERHSPYKAFFYSSREKQAWVLQKLEELDIPYRETDNGFEAQECYVETVRKLEKEYKAPRTAYRDRLREDIDRLLMQSKSSNELFEKLEAEGYTVKYGKYIAAKPKDSGSYIRLKSLGEHYTEFALRNRIAAKLKFEREIAQHIENLKKIKAPNYELIRMVQLYTVTFGKNRLPVRRRDQSKPLSWTNDAELDKLLQLNQKIKAGATLESLRNDFAEKEKICGQKSEKLSAEQARLKKFLEMQLKLEIIFDGKQHPRPDERDADGKGQAALEHDCRHHLGHDSRQGWSAAWSRCA